MNQFQNELLQKKDSIIKDLQSKEKSLISEVKSNPKLWNEECFKFNLNCQATMVFEADILVQNRAERLQKGNRARFQQLKKEPEAILSQIQSGQF